MIKVLLALFLLLSSSISWAQSINAEVDGAGKKNWRAIVDISHVPILRDDQEAYTDVVAIGDYFLSKKHRVRVLQSGSKLYEKYDSEYEFQMSDTQLYHYYAFEDKPLGLGYIWRNQFSLPISDISRRDELVSRFTSTMFINKVLAGGSLFLSLRPFARYNWYQYRTSPGGRRLPLYTFGSTALASYSLTNKIALTGVAYYSIEGTNSSQFDSEFVQKEQGIYSFTGSVSYQLLKKIGVYGSYSSGAANYINQGRYEVYLYDQDSSRYSLGMTGIF
jgi:hypothetical protein